MLSGNEAEINLSGGERWRNNMEFLTVVIVLATFWSGAVYTHIDYKEDKKYEEYAEKYKEVKEEKL
jgi:hypothetical protein